MKTGTTKRDASGSITSLKKYLEERKVPKESENSHFNTRQGKTIRRILDNLNQRKKPLDLIGDYKKTADRFLIHTPRPRNKFNLSSSRKRA